MFIHFAFGELGRKGCTEEQTKKVLEDIISFKRLKISKCKEFIPAFSPQEGRSIPWNRFTKTKNGLKASIGLNEIASLPAAPPIKYLPVDVPMVCFTNVAFKALKSSSHAMYYGKFGIVLSDTFLKAKGIKPVKYYEEESLSSDPLVLKWNHLSRNGGEKEQLKIMAGEITSYRKPAYLFPSFKESIQAIVSRKNGKVVVEYFTYNRYPYNYNFCSEKEYRIIFSEGNNYLYFDEKDLFMIIVPNAVAMVAVREYLCRNWNVMPKLVVFPD